MFVCSLVCLLVCSFFSSHPATGYNGSCAAGGTATGERRAALRAPGGGGTLLALFNNINIGINFQLLLMLPIDTMSQTVKNYQIRSLYWRLSLT